MLNQICFLKSKDNESFQSKIAFHEFSYGIWHKDIFIPLHLFYDFNREFGKDSPAYLVYGIYVESIEKDNSTFLDKALEFAYSNFEFDRQTGSMFLTKDDLEKILYTIGISYHPFIFRIWINEGCVFSTNDLLGIYSHLKTLNKDMIDNIICVEQLYRDMNGEVFIESASAEDLLKFYQGEEHIYMINDKKRYF